MLKLNGALPFEVFVSQPRSMLELERWKARELHSFLLYTGPAVLKKKTEIYDLFTALSVATSILLMTDSFKRSSYLEYSQELLNVFANEVPDFLQQYLERMDD